PPRAPRGRRSCWRHSEVIVRPASTGRRVLVGAPAFRRSAAALATWGLACGRVARGTSVARVGGMADSTRSLIRTLRQQLGMTQEEFAHEIAVTVSTVNRWENAHAEPSKLAWKAIHGLARKRGVADDILRRSTALADG